MCSALIPYFFFLGGKGSGRVDENELFGSMYRIWGFFYYEVVCCLFMAACLLALFNESFPFLHADFARVDLKALKVNLNCVKMARGHRLRRKTMALLGWQTPDGVGNEPEESNFSLERARKLFERAVEEGNRLQDAAEVRKRFAEEKERLAERKGGSRKEESDRGDDRGDTVVPIRKFLKRERDERVQGLDPEAIIRYH